MATSRKRNVEIEFIVDDTKAKKSLKEVETNVTKTGKAFANFAKVAVAGLAIDKVVDFARSSIDAYSNLEESLNAVKVTFGGASAAILDMGESAAKSLGLSNAEFNALAVQFSSFAETIAQESGTSVVPVIEQLTTRAADFASVMNIDVAEAARIFQSGLAGETEPLKRYGIILSDAAIKQHAYATGIARTGEELTDNQKTMARWSLLLKETEKTAGDFANTSDSLANQTRILAAETENAKAAFGEGLAPILADAQATANDLMVVLGEIGEWMGGEGPGAVGVFAQAVGDTFNVLTFGLIPAIGAWADSIRNAEEEQKKLEQAQWDALAPSEAQIKIAASADEKFRQQAEAMAELAENTDDAATAQQKLTELQKEAADPAFKLLRAIERYDDAQDDYTEAITKFGHGSEQAQEAAIDLANAQADLNGAGADFAAQGGAASISAIEELLEAAGVLPETIQAIIEAIKEYNDTPITRKAVFVPGVGNVVPGSGGTIGGNGTMIGFAEGGVVPGPKGAPMPALVHGGETVFTPEQMKLLGAVGSGGPQVNLYASTLSDRQLKEISEMARRS